jgi:hypothetical protein
MRRRLLEDLVSALACLCPLPQRARFRVLAWVGDAPDLLEIVPTDP